MTFGLVVPALLMGLVGSTHCVVMCGGVVATTCSALPLQRDARWRAQVGHVVAYNVGRVTSYACAGGIAGALGASLASFALVERAQLGLRLVAGALMLAVGLYVCGFARALRWLERAGEPLWRRIAPVARRLVPVRSPVQALALGLLWGWMPCGLVYAALAASVASGSGPSGALAMASFGAGTLPMLVAMGTAGAAVARAARIRWVRVAAGVALVTLGATQTAQAWQASPAIAHGGAHACCAGHRR
ncbi:MAG TPA: sulfite exporter TauE/SafE family protein [Polyangiaceae bacterium]|nr:sulfite exporter TauE/SafE family protein [Polyangiaceae bacterium]